MTKATGTSVRLGCIGQHNHAKTIGWHHREKRLASQRRLALRCRAGALGAAVSVAVIVAVAVAAMIVVAAAARLIFRVGDAEAAADVGQRRARHQVTCWQLSLRVNQVHLQHLAQEHR